MAKLAEILADKGSHVVSVDAGATVLDTVRAMVDANVGAVLVTDGNGIAGIFTERDYLRRVGAEERAPRETRVSEVMTSPLVYVTPDTEVDETMALMTDRRIRHLPVLDGESLAGMISIGDLVNFQSKAQTFQIRTLTDYITAR